MQGCKVVRFVKKQLQALPTLTNEKADSTKRWVRFMMLGNNRENDADYFRASMSSAGVRSCCSPVSMFLRVTLPAAISLSPARTTKGICLALA